MSETPVPSTNLDMTLMHKPEMADFASQFSESKPKILLLYGSLRDRSYSRLVIEESARLLDYFGAEAKIFDPRGLPQPDTEDENHPKVKTYMVAASFGRRLCVPSSVCTTSNTQYRTPLTSFHFAS